MSGEFKKVDKRLLAIELDLMDIKEKLKNIVWKSDFIKLEKRVTQLEKRLEVAIK